MKKQKTIAIIDYGLGNLYSLVKAVKCFANNVVVTKNPDAVRRAAAVVIPGVGAFAAGMEGLRERNLIGPIKDFAKSGKPMMGICLGAQLLFSKGFEFGEHKGLDIISGKVSMFPDKVANKEKIPHIGWNGIYPSKKDGWDETIFNNVKNNNNFYFVHSYIMIPDHNEDTLSLAEYGGLEFCAVAKVGNVYGVQFHPEKSGKTGLTVIKNFTNLVN